MSNRRPSTLIAVLRGGLVRAEFARGLDQPATSVQRTEASAGASLAESLAAAARAGGKLRGPVWVLCDEVWSQTLDLDTRPLRQASDEELRQTLGYEVQLLSGLAASETALGWSWTIDERGERRFWIAAMPLGDLESVRAAVRELGGRLAGVLHPAAAPRSLASGEGSWSRLEWWPATRAELSAEEGGQVSVRVRAVDPGRRTREVAREASFGEVLVAPGGPAMGSNALRLDDDAALKTWIEAWGAALASQEAHGAPIVAPPERRTSWRTRAIVAAGLALAVLAVCAFDAMRARHVQRELGLQLAETSGAASASNARRANIESLRKQVAELEGSLAATSRDGSKGWAAQLPVDVLERLTVGTPADVVVREVSMGPTEFVVRGVCAQPASVDVLARTVEAALAARGYHAAPSRKQLLSGGLDDGSYSFEVVARVPGTTSPRRMEDDP